MESRKIVAIFLVVLFFCWQVEGWVYSIQSDPEHTEGGCYTDTYDLGKMKIGERKRVKEMCAEAVCEERGAIFVNGCAAVMAEPPCYLAPGDNSKPFPDCCYEFKCEDEEKMI
ncbi:hypothetical protein TcasGA2_TC032631 [Tribolium castaneum]|uniref:Single domain-containing protein n=1 Tax=Tribolium castaneum TaxID=7070 RepID=A0A139WK93_TRICA|nr:hypothetical protein TcasGA2_TC032631 [Tribolium castaneum]